MTGWVPIVSDIVDSSLWEEKDYVIKVFLTMLAKKDADFIVKGDIYSVAKWANKKDNIDEVLDAIRVLSSPDTKKPLVQQDFEGRRIEAVPEGWKILNGEKYRRLVSEFKEKNRKREWAQNKRATKRSGQSGGEASYVQNVQNLGREEADRIQDVKDQMDQIEEEVGSGDLEGPY